jgi:sulfate adenylyltransferase subunit 1 (EFTu-like GTPase family)
MHSDKSTELLRFTTAGSVDDGKSTLIGRLLYDSKSIFQDQYDAIEEVSKRRGEEGINLALLTDGLKAERSRASRLMLHIDTFLHPNASSSLRIHRDIFNTPGTW